MRTVSALGILFSSIILGCAPVASSGPKMARNSPSTGDKIVADSGRFYLSTISSQIIGLEESEELEKKLTSADFHIEDKFDVKSVRRNDIRDDRGATGLGLSSQINRAEVRVIFILNVPGKSFSKEIQDQLKLEGYRTDKGKFSFSVSRNEASDKAWTFVKENLNSVWIVDREVKVKN